MTFDLDSSIQHEGESSEFTNYRVVVVVVDVGQLSIFQRTLPQAAFQAYLLEIFCLNIMPMKRKRRRRNGVKGI